MSKKVKTDRCCNPWKSANEGGHIGKDLRKISQTIKQKFPNLPENAKICFDCRNKSKTDSTLATSNVSNNNCDEDMGIDEVNDVSEDMYVSDCENDVRSVREMELEEMLTGLKEKYKSLNGNDPLKLRILTIAPSSWSVNKIAKEFGTSWQLARKSKELKASKGVLADTTAYTRNTLPTEVINEIKAFYESDCNSRILPGKKDCISVEIDGIKTNLQKRLLLMNLKELYILFKNSNPDTKVGFSTFAKLRPKNCVFAGASGTHIVCVCTIHQNVKMMLDAINIKQLTEGSERVISGYKECLEEIMCKKTNPQCHLGECKNCPGTEALSSRLLELLEKNNYDQVEYNLWTATDRCQLETYRQTNENFVNSLCNKLKILKPHSFLAKEQSDFIRDKKKQFARRRSVSDV